VIDLSWFLVLVPGAGLDVAKLCHHGLSRVETSRPVRFPARPAGISTATRAYRPTAARNISPGPGGPYKSHGATCLIPSLGRPPLPFAAACPPGPGAAARASGPAPTSTRQAVPPSSFSFPALPTPGADRPLRKEVCSLPRSIERRAGGQNKDGGDRRRFPSLPGPLHCRGAPLGAGPPLWAPAFVAPTPWRDPEPLAMKFRPVLAASTAGDV